MQRKVISGAFLIDIRVDYEQYFYLGGVAPAISEQKSKIVVEFVAHF